MRNSKLNLFSQFFRCGAYLLRRCGANKSCARVCRENIEIGFLSKICFYTKKNYNCCLGEFFLWFLVGFGHFMSCFDALRRYWPFYVVLCPKTTATSCQDADFFPGMLHILYILLLSGKSNFSIYYYPLTISGENGENNVIKNSLSLDMRKAYIRAHKIKRISNIFV